DDRCTHAVPVRGTAGESLAANAMPANEQAKVTTKVHCQPPARWAIHATTGGAMNWPSDEACCIIPIVVDTVEGPGASRTPSMNNVAGTTPPPSENMQTARYRSAGGSPNASRESPICANAATLPSAMTTNPQRISRSGAT